MDGDGIAAELAGATVLAPARHSLGNTIARRWLLGSLDLCL